GRGAVRGFAAGLRQCGRAAAVAELTVFIPLVDSLRCIAGHDETWLVASIERSEERDIRQGFLGCPICLAEYPIRDGIAYFGVDPAEPVVAAMAGVEDDDALRLAAAL